MSSLAIARLMARRYRYVTFDARVLLAAARESNWTTDAPFSIVVHEAGLREVDDASLVRVVCDFLYLLHSLRRPEVSDIRRNDLTLALLNTAFRGRNHRRVADQLKSIAGSSYGTESQFAANLGISLDSWLLISPPLHGLPDNKH
jgi:hypothetical protein